MRRHLPICAVLLAFTATSGNAQQKEAMLQRMEVRGAPFDLVVAMPKPQGAIFDLADSPDALVMHLIGGELALGFDDAEGMLKAVDKLRRPVGAVHVKSPDYRSPMPVAVYLVPAGE